MQQTLGKVCLNIDLISFDQRYCIKVTVYLLRQDCDASLTTSLAAQWRAFPSHLIMARLRLLHVFKWRNCKRGGSVSNRGVVCLNVCCGQLDGGEVGF